jgi:hypothetical protein
MTTVDWVPQQTSWHRFSLLTVPGIWPKQMDVFERKKIVGEFNALIEKLDDNLSEKEDDRIREELDRIWYKELDSIAEIQVDPLRMRLPSMGDVQIIDKRAVDEGGHVRFMGQLHDTELDVWDSLDATVPWSRLDVCFSGIYEEVAEFWGITRPQDMEVYNAYHVPKEVMES